MKNIQNWKGKPKHKKSKRDSMTKNIRDVYKEEILDTRITVSGIISESRMIDFLNFKKLKRIYRQRKT